MYVVFVELNPFAPVKLLVNVKNDGWQEKNTQMPVQCLLIICPFVSILSMLSFTGSLCCCLLQIVNND